MLIISTILVLCGYAPASYALTRREGEAPKTSIFTLVLVILSMAHILATTLISGLALSNFSTPVYVTTHAALILLALLFSRTHISASWRFAASRFTTVRHALHPIHKGVLISACIVAIMLGASLVRIYFAPPNVFDTQVYHLTIPLTWLHDNHMTLAEDVPVGRLNYATKLSKALTFWHMRLGGSMTYVELSQFPAFVLLLLSTYILLTLTRTTRSFTILTTLLVGAIPIVMIETSTLQDHTLLTGLHFATIALIGALHERWIRPQSFVVLISLSSALLLASKFSAPAHLGLIGLLACVIYWKSLLGAVKKTQWKSYMVGTLILISLGGIWYISNMAYYGSPFGPKHAQSKQENIFLNNIKDIPLRIFDHGYRYTPDLIGISGFGPHVAMFGWVGLIGLIASRRMNRHHLLIGLTTLAILATYFTQYYTLYNYRLFMFVPVAILILSMSHLSKQAPVVRNIIFILAPIGLLYTLIMIQFPDYLAQPVRAYRDLVRHYPESRTAVRFDYGSDKFKRDASWLFIDQFVPATEPILFITQNKGAGYDDNVLAPYYDQFGRRDVYWGGDLATSDLFTPDGNGTSALIPYMRERGIRYLHNNSVFYFEPVKLVPGDEFVQLTPQLWYLP